MKKNTTKILMAALALFMAIGIATGTTFAWFALNNTVEVSSMQIQAKSNSAFLVINETAEGATTAAKATYIRQNGTDADTSDDNPTSANLEVNAQIYPSAPALTAAEAAYLPASTGKQVGGAAITTAGVQVTNGSTASAVTNWYTAEAAAPTAADMKAGTARQLTTFTDYVVVKNLYLTVATGSETAYNLTVTPTFTQYSTGNDIDAVKFLIVTSDGGYAAISTANNNSAVDIKGSNTGLTENDVITVTIYLYYDGNDDAVFTNNKVNLTGATVALEFAVDTTAP